MLKRTKRGVLAVSRALGINALIARSQWRREQLVIFCYHGVSLEDEHLWNPALFVSPDFLKQRLTLLQASQAKVLPLDEALARLHAGTLPPRAVSITFDDGNYDFYARAYPLLLEFETPATVYVSTYYCLDQRPVFDPLISYILWKGRRRDIATIDIFPDYPVIKTHTEADRSAAHHFVYDFARCENLSADQKHELARDLAGRLQVDLDGITRKRILHLMTPQEVGEVSGDLVDVQLHTHRHRTPRDKRQFFREIDDNRYWLAQMRGGSEQLRHFCYPSGDYDVSFFGWLRDLGIASATTCDPGAATAVTDPMRLPRILDSSSLSAGEFEGWISGVSNLLPRRRSAGGSASGPDR